MGELFSVAHLTRPFFLHQEIEPGDAERQPRAAVTRETISLAKMRLSHDRFMASAQELRSSRRAAAKKRNG